MNTRTEHDSMGPLEVPASALYQAQTERARQNFRLSPLKLPQRFIQALLLLKHAAAVANRQLGVLAPSIADAIIHAAQNQLAQTDMQHYPLDVFQTGSATSSNMNVNEVLATLASRELGSRVSPNDHVNLGQSSNDSIPTAIHISACLALEQQLLPALQRLQRTLTEKSQQIGHIVKTGRTHLMDAMPVTFGQVLGGWQAQLAAAEQGLLTQQHNLQQLAQGGTAVGTGINAAPGFALLFCQELSALTGQPFRPAGNYFSAIGSQDTAVATSGALKVLAVSLMKLCNDLRWMNSGPLAGLAEISLPALQPGSSIMPGKVNPVIPEAVAMLCAQVIGNDASITIAGQSGNFELNVMLPLVAYNLLQSIELLANGCNALAGQAIAGFSVNEANIAKQAYQQQRPILDVAQEHTGYSRTELEALLNPAKLANGGVIT